MLEAEQVSDFCLRNDSTNAIWSAVASFPFSCFGLAERVGDEIGRQRVCGQTKGGARRVRERVPGLMRSAGRVLSQHPERCPVGLSADVIDTLISIGAVDLSKVRWKQEVELVVSWTGYQGVGQPVHLTADREAGDSARRTKARRKSARVMMPATLPLPITSTRFIRFNASRAATCASGVFSNTLTMSRVMTSSMCPPCDLKYSPHTI